MKKEPIQFLTVVSASGRADIRERVKADGIIERLRLRFYPGVEKALKVQPFVFNKGNKSLEPLITYPKNTQSSISGDDDLIDLDLYHEVNYDDEVVIIAENESGTYDYTLNCIVSVMYPAQEKGVK